MLIHQCDIDRELAVALDELFVPSAGRRANSDKAPRRVTGGQRL
jgi:hypothetical protein